MKQKPSLGRVIIYVDEENRKFAATIAFVHTDEIHINIGALEHDGTPFSVERVVYDIEWEQQERMHKLRSWHWPPRI